MDSLTPEQRHKNMKSIKSKDTEIERILRKALRDKGYGYRKNYKALPGCPDIVLVKYQIAIFCDSEFFHGKDWEILKPKLENGKNPEFWINKITKNIERDDLVNKELLYLNWSTSNRERIYLYVLEMTLHQRSLKFLRIKREVCINDIHDDAQYQQKHYLSDVYVNTLEHKSKA